MRAQGIDFDATTYNTLLKLYVNKVDAKSAMKVTSSLIVSPFHSIGDEEMMM